MQRGFAAIVRLLFSADMVPFMREHLCLLAGKVLQKKEVCNKADAPLSGSAATSCRS